MTSDPPDIAFITRELRAEERRAKAETAAWQKRAKLKPDDLRIARMLLLWSRHRASLILELRRRITVQVRPAQPARDAFYEFQRRRFRHDDEHDAQVKNV